MVGVSDEEAGIGQHGALLFQTTRHWARNRAWEAVFRLFVYQWYYWV